MNNDIVDFLVKYIWVIPSGLLLLIGIGLSVWLERRTSRLSRNNSLCTPRFMEIYYPNYVSLARMKCVKCGIELNEISIEREIDIRNFEIHEAALKGIAMFHRVNFARCKECGAENVIQSTL
jgi:hypothetical protein